MLGGGNFSPGTGSGLGPLKKAHGSLEIGSVLLEVFLWGADEWWLGTRVVELLWGLPVVMARFGALKHLSRALASVLGSGAWCVLLVEMAAAAAL